MRLALLFSRFSKCVVHFEFGILQLTDFSIISDVCFFTSEMMLLRV